MRRNLLLILILLLSISLFGCTKGTEDSQVNADSSPVDSVSDTAGTGTVNEIPGSTFADTAGSPLLADSTALPEASTGSAENEIASLVGSFGSKLKMVSLLAPEEMLGKVMRENYGGLVSESLLSEWIKSPENAPGRTVSSPWPDRIEILGIERLSEDAYEVKGNIIEVTSVEEVNGGAAAKRPITLTIRKISAQWLIDEVSLDDHADAQPVTYENSKYGFDFFLPASWSGYSIITDKWEGLAIDGEKGEKVIATGPIVKIRHPAWTSQEPRQDIPIMIFSLKQWNSLQKDEFHIGAAPVGPTELGRNSTYVFALPARYNFAFPAGYEEVAKIIEGKALQPK